MRKLIMWNVVTLDDCFEGDKPWDLSFHQLVWGPELESFINEQLSEADTLIFGENTYKGMADYWQKETEKPADRMNSIKKIVCSTTRENAEWNNTTVVKDAVAEISKLKNEGDKPMFVFGSSILSQSLMNAGLFDEIRLCIAPIILGKGRRLFNEDLQKQNLKLIDSKTFQNGGVLLKYEVLK